MVSPTPSPSPSPNSYVDSSYTPPPEEQICTRLARLLAERVTPPSSPMVDGVARRITDAIEDFGARGEEDQRAVLATPAVSPIENPDVAANELYEMLIDNMVPWSYFTEDRLRPFCDPWVISLLRSLSKSEQFSVFSTPGWCLATLHYTREIEALFSDEEEPPVPDEIVRQYGHLKESFLSYFCMPMIAQAFRAKPEEFLNLPFLVKESIISLAIKISLVFFDPRQNTQFRKMNEDDLNRIKQIFLLYQNNPHHYPAYYIEQFLRRAIESLVIRD